MTYSSRLARYRARNRAYNAQNRLWRNAGTYALKSMFPDGMIGNYFNWGHRLLSKKMDENPTEVPEIISDPWAKKGSNPAPNIGSNNRPNIGSNQFGQVRRFHHRRSRRRAGVKLIPRYKRRKR